MKKIVIGVDVGGTKCAVTSGEIGEDDSIRIIKKVAFPTEVSKGVDQTLNHIYAGIDDLLEGKSASDSVASIGVSCGGPLDSIEGLVLSPPNLPGWDRIPIVRLLENRYHENIYAYETLNIKNKNRIILGVLSDYKIIP